MGTPCGSRFTEYDSEERTECFQGESSAKISRVINTIIVLGDHCSAVWVGTHAWFKHVEMVSDSFNETGANMVNANSENAIEFFRW